MIFDNRPSALWCILQNRLISIAVAVPQRLAALPEAPTFEQVRLEPVNRLAQHRIIGPRGVAQRGGV